MLSVILPERLKSQWVLDLMVRFARPTLFNHTFERATNDLGKEKTKPKGKGAKGARGGAGPGPPR